MQPHLMLLLSLVGIGLTVEVDIPVSIKVGEWDYQVETGVRSGVPSASDPAKIVSFPTSIWDEVGRQIVLVPTDTVSAKSMQAEKTWGSFLFSHIKTLDQLIICQFSDLPESNSITELKPIPTTDQERFLSSLGDKWLIPLPEGFSETSRGRGFWFVWKPMLRTNAILKAGRGAVKTKSHGGLDEDVYWYGRNLTADEAMLASIRLCHTLEPHNAYGHSFLRTRRTGRYEDEQPELYWASGPFLIHLRVPEDRLKGIAKAYLEKYPPTWDGQVQYEPTRLALQVLERTISEMQKHREGPLEFLRYSFRSYPFDLAFQDALGVLPDNDLRAYNENIINKIQTTWSLTPVDKIKLADYKEAIFAHRQDLIDKIIAARERIVKHGIKHLGPEGFWSYGDAESDK